MTVVMVKEIQICHDIGIMIQEVAPDGVLLDKALQVVVLSRTVPKKRLL